MNKVVLTGNLTRDPEVRQSGDLKIAKYSLACRRAYKKDETDFINIVAFGKQAEFAEKYLSKGMKIGVVGRIQTGSWTAQDGSKRYSFDVVAEEHEFLEKKAESASESVTEQNEWHEAAQEELPFV